MKRVLSIVMLLVIATALCACKGGTGNEGTDSVYYGGKITVGITPLITLSVPIVQSSLSSVLSNINSIFLVVWEISRLGVLFCKDYRT